MEGVRGLKKMIRVCFEFLECLESLEDVKFWLKSGEQIFIWGSKMSQKIEIFEKSRFLSVECIYKEEIHSSICF